MTEIANFFKAFGGFFGSVVDFISSLFEDLVWLIEQLNSTADNMLFYIDWLPAGVISMFVVFVTVIIILRILGRD